MTRRGLEKLLDRVLALRDRAGSVRYTEFIPIVKKVGRMRFQGRHPVWRRAGWAPLPIPEHPKPMANGTAIEIAEQLEQDIQRLLTEGDFDDDAEG
jgi:hypothetical protein